MKTWIRRVIEMSFSVTGNLFGLRVLILFSAVCIRTFVYCQGYCVDNDYAPVHGYRHPPPSYPPPSHQLYYEGAVLRYYCDKGYRVEPLDIQTCGFANESFRWIPTQLPVCQEVTENCTDLEPVENGRVQIFPPNKLYATTKMSTWPSGSQAHYTCNDDYELNPHISVRSCLEGVWSDMAPQCVSITYCPRPASIDHGSILCCLTTEKNGCCSNTGRVQFECDPGYKMESGNTDCACGDGGVWLDCVLPRCVPDSTTIAPFRTGAPPFSDSMVKTVVGVAAGVLSLLLVVIILTFCKPRLKDIKRRWRDFREDENELIINGQRVILPSYEEAISCNVPTWCDSHEPSSYLNSISHDCTEALPSDVTQPPQSNLAHNIISMQAGSSVQSAVVLADTRPSSSVTGALHNHERYKEDAFTSSGAIETPPSYDHVGSFDADVAGPSGVILSEIRGFEDSFVAINNDTSLRNRDGITKSPTLSSSSNDSATVPLISSTRSHREIEESKNSRLQKELPHVVGRENITKKVTCISHDKNRVQSVPDFDITSSALGSFIVTGTYEGKVPDRFESSVDISLQADSTTV